MTSSTIQPVRRAQWRRFLPYALSGGLFLLGLFALYHLLAHIHVHEVVAEVRNTPARRILLAGLTTLAGYLCLSGYDWTALRYLGRRLPPATVLTGGLMAYAVGNTIGLTAVSGGTIRWRLYSGLGLDAYAVAAISSFAAIAFGIMTTLAGLGALAVAPTAAKAILPFSPEAIRAGALAGMLLVAAPVLAASVREAHLRIRRFTLRAPRLGVLAQQIPVSLGDLLFAALTLYVLLPENGPGFFPFLAAFAAATMLGVLSYIPGGIGVFEAVILASMPPGAPLAEVAAALLLYRLLYYVVPFALALLAMATFEVWQQREKLRPGRHSGVFLRPVAPVMRSLSPLVPLVLATMTFGFGLWLSISALLPPLTLTSRTMEKLFPYVLVEGSTLLSSALGAALMLLALGLARRSTGAYWLTLAGVVVALALALPLNRDPQQALPLALAALALLPFRRVFRRRTVLTHAAMTPAWGALLLAAVAGFGFTLLFAHKSIPYTSELWWQFSANAHAPRALRAGLVASLTLGLGTLLLLLRAPKSRPTLPDSHALALAGRIAAAGDDPNASFALTGDKALLFSPDEKAFLMYASSGRSLIAYGGPVGPAEPAEDVALDFVGMARDSGMTPVFYEVGAPDIPLMLSLGMTLHKMGETATVDLAGFSLDGPALKRLRATHKRARRDGLTLEMVSPPYTPSLLAELHKISDAWLLAHHAREKGFSVGRFEPQWLERWPLALVRHEGEIIAFANVLVTGSRQCATIDLMRYRQPAPAATMEFLFTALMLALKEEGYQQFSLGMAPLSGLEPARSRRLWDRFGTLVYRRGGSFYNFAGLRAFKEKFHPLWEPRYLAVPGLLPPLRPLADAARLIARKAPGKEEKPARQGPLLLSGRRVSPQGHGPRSTGASWFSPPCPQL